MPRIKWLVIALVACIGSLGPVVVWADEGPAGLEMEAVAAYDGHFKYGEWLPIWVYVQNSGPDLEVEAQVEVVGSWGGTTYANAVSLPTGSRKRVPVYVLPNNFTRKVEVRLVSEGEVLLTREVTVRSHLNIEYLVGIVSPSRGALSLIESAPPDNVQRDVTVIDVPLADLPERPAGLQSIDCLVLNDVDTPSLTPEQQQALEAWVRGGGHLVIGGGSGAQKPVTGLPASLAIVAPEQQLEVDALDGLAAFAGEPIRVAGPFVLASSEPLQGKTAATEQSAVLVQGQTLGNGRIDFVALDLATSPFDAWAGTVSFWRRLVFADASYPQGIPPDVSERQMRAGQMGYAVSNLPSLALPSVQWLALVLGVYVVLVGPVNYVVLRWRRAMQLAWVTIPAITIVFSAGAFGLGYAMRGTDLIVSKIAIVDMQQDGTAYTNTYVGVFSPAQQSYEIEVSGDGLLSPLNPDANPFSSAGGSATGGGTVFVQGRPARVRGLTVNQWSMQTFVYEAPWTDAGRIAADLWIEADGLAGTVRNETPFTLEDVVVVLGMNFVRLGNLAPGQTAEVQLALQGELQAFGPPLGYRLFQQELQGGGPGGLPREVQLKQTILDSLTQSTMRPGALGGDGAFDSLMFLAWFDQAPPGIAVRGRQPSEQVTALLHTPLSYGVADADVISIPPGLIPGRVVEMPREGGPCGAGGMAAIYIGRGDAVFEYRLLSGMDEVEVDTLKLVLGSDGAWGRAPDTALYEWGAGEWAMVEDPELGTNLVADGARFVSEQGLVRVRLSNEGNHGGCMYVQLGLEGQRTDGS